jgi:hypothetical protein
LGNGFWQRDACCSPGSQSNYRSMGGSCSFRSGRFAAYAFRSARYVVCCMVLPNQLKGKGRWQATVQTSRAK